MTPEQKKRIAHEISNWQNAKNDHTASVTGDRMSALLQELIDALEPEPVGYTNETELDYVRTYEALPVSGVFWPTSDEDACVALYAAPPAPSVPDEQLQAAFDRGLKAGNDQSVAQQIEIHKLHDSLAAPQPEPLSDERIFELIGEYKALSGASGKEARLVNLARAIEREIFLGGGGK